MARLIASVVLVCLVGWTSAHGNGFLTLVEHVSEFLGVGEFLYEQIKQENDEDAGDKKKIITEMNFAVLQANIDDLNEELMSSLEDMPERVELERSMTILAKDIGKIDESFRKFSELMKRASKLQHSTLERFARQTVDSFCGLKESLLDVHLALTPNEINTNKTVLSLLNKHMKEYSLICTTNKSLQQILHELYRSVVAAEIKAYVMTRYALEILHLETKAEMTITKNSFNERHKALTKTFRKFMRSPHTRRVLRCDPQQHEEDVSYTELKGVFWMFATSNSLTGAKTCAVTDIVNKFNSWWDACSSCDDAIYNPRFHCPNAYLRDCQDRPLTLCPVNSGNITDNRIVNYVKENECAKPVLVDPPDLCMCICERHRLVLTPIKWSEGKPLPRIPTYQRADGYFDLDPALADTANNYVVTGARLRKKNHVVCIEIQEGKLVANGNIEENSVRWVEREIRDPYEVEPGSDEEKSLNYQALEWNGKRKVNLLTQETNENELVTGLAFKLINDALTIQVYKQPFDPTSGNLLGPDNSQEDSYILNNGQKNSLPNKIRELKLDNLDIPSNSRKSNVLDSKLDQYLKFTTTGLEYDLSQTTIPFIDIQQVTTNPPLPMTGAGLHHKGTRGFGGYVALHLLTYLNKL